MSAGTLFYKLGPKVGRYASRAIRGASNVVGDANRATFSSAPVTRMGRTGVPAVEDMLTGGAAAPWVSKLGQEAAASEGLMERIARGVGALKPTKAGVFKGLAGLDLALFALPGLMGVAGDAADELSGKNQRERIRRYVEEKKRGLVMQAEMDRLQRDMAHNIAVMSQVMPERVQELMVGRRLPKGAVVIGGQMNGDLLQQAALDMTAGVYQKDDPQAALAQMVGGM